MNKWFVVALALAMAVSAPAFANKCPVQMGEIDAALAKNPKLSAEQLAEVKKHRALGEDMHKAGKHNESVEHLTKALQILGM
jgi:hypothetical protein